MISDLRWSQFRTKDRLVEPMRWITYRSERAQRIGVVDSDERVRDLTGLLGTADLAEVIESWPEAADSVARVSAIPARPLAEVELLAPFPRPRRNVFCVGKNYREH